MTTGHLQLDAVTHRYDSGAEAVVHDVSVDVRAAAVHALVGPSGSGKTTLLRIIAGLLPPTHGRVLLDGVDVTTAPTHRRGIVLVHQEGLLFGHLSVEDNVAYPLRVRGASRAESRRAAAPWLEQVELAGFGDRHPDELSGGQRQRVALARALAASPSALLLDEPLSALDAGLRDSMRRLLLDVQRRQQLTMLIVTHDQREAASLAEDVTVLLDGAVAATAPPDTLYRRPPTEAVARFLGARNLFDAVAEPGALLTTAFGTLDAAAPHDLLGPCRIGIWPEDVVIGPAEGAIEATVDDVVFDGSTRHATLRLPGETLLHARLDRWSGLGPGDAVKVSLPRDRVVIWH